VTPPPPSATGRSWRLADRVIGLDAPVVMGILNLTPDSFSDGGELPTVELAVARGIRMVEAGAGILDLGGESTRPGAPEVPVDEESARVLPVLEALAREVSVPLSVDTRKAEVARRVLEAGASIVNDVSGLGHDPEMAGVVAERRAGLVLMHMRGTPADMGERAVYQDLVEEVGNELEASVARAREAGIPDTAVVLDPGIGFAKTPAQSFRLIRELERLGELGFPLLVGASRKSFLGALLQVPPRERVTAGAVVAALAWERGARIFRTHDVEATVHALRTARAVAGEVEPRAEGDGSPGSGAPGPSSLEGNEAGVIR
jgi:dihydropteroate synthase